MEKMGTCGVARKEKRRKGRLRRLGRRTVCARSGEEECVESVWEKSTMWEKTDEECVEAVWEKSRTWEKRPSRAARSKILLLGVQGI
ncbi:hypothetical protein DEO72_LG5g3039 [Vigna unguiculata]|uniref:Uncharacterized protein n=1 Tax=Vigna unguiculata TaxID=3917 RepID=A0A4D6M110_VIGUN|nr:hypothetical protein DEO72_LG5g3039 [Vigna unguiculata]